MWKGSGLAALLTLATLAGASGTASADFTLPILHTNDFHSRIEPVTRFDSSCGGKDNAAGKCFGGSARLVTGSILQSAARFCGVGFPFGPKGASDLMKKTGETTKPRIELDVSQLLRLGGAYEEAATCMMGSKPAIQNFKDSDSRD